MEPFLLKVARQILDENPSTMDRVMVVFNNHRPELFLRQQFKKISAQEGLTFFLPQTMVIDDMVASLSGLKVVQPEFLLFELYQIHIELEGEERKYKTFEEFISFGEMMLSDFSEVDRYMVDARDLFQNLHGLKQLGEWDLEDPQMSDFQQRYLHFYRSLYQYYTRLRERLVARGQAYSGMAYRKVAEGIADVEWPMTTYFVGFNAISECERAIIGELVRRGKGHLMTDGDSYYYDDPLQEAGYFLRKHSQEFANLGHYGPSLFATSEKKITIVECPENVLQCKYAGQLLAGHPDWLDGGAEGTAIVLADESMLIPTLNGLPEAAEKDYRVNVTMGYAYADSQLHSLVQKLLSLYRRHNERGYYHADAVDVLADWYISRLTGMTAARHTATTFLEKENLVRVKAAKLAAILPDFDIQTLFPDDDLTPAGCLEQVQRVVAMLTTEGTLTANPRERQAAGALAEVLDYLHNLQQEYHFVDNIATLEKIYQRIAKRHTIAFLGEPLSGLQILGMLETRNLDFRRIILLSANEGVLPAARSAATLIPHELKRAFNLPTYEEKDSVYAYNFYRLLQRAEEVYLVYSSDAKTPGKGEESRLLKQVRSELARRFPKTITVNDLVVDTGGGLHHNENDTSTPGLKDDSVMQRLYSISERTGFSPSALSKYVECPLKYYYMSVLGLKELESVEDDIDASELGDAVHNVLKTIYEPFVGRKIDAATLKEARNNVESLLDSEMERLMSGGRLNEGRNMFLRSVALTQLNRLLEREADIAESHTLELVAAEEDYSYTLWEQDGHKVRIGGRVDRIDRIDGQLRVIDYKTGRLKDDEISFSKQKKSMPAKWMQLMCYALMYRRRFPSDETLLTGIYPLRFLRSDVRVAKWDKQKELTNAKIDDFEKLLGDIIGELLNPNESFNPTPSDDNCQFCPAASFCRGKRLS